MICGGRGQGEEGVMICCVQCGQCYHPFCVGAKVWCCSQWYSYHVLETISAEDAWLQVLCGLQITNIALCVHAISCPNVMHNHITGSRLVFVAENQKFGH